MKKLKGKKSLIFKSSIFKKILIYTLTFSILAFYLIKIFNYYDKTFIWNPDGFLQHIVSLRYFRELLVGFIRTGNLSTFTWCLGNGIDMLANLTFCIAGDPFAFLSLLVRTVDVNSLYSILVIVRIYFIGIAFLAYSEYRKLKVVPSVMGSLMYVFSSYALYATVRHPWFSNAMIILPLALIGIEKIIKEDKTIFYTIIIALAFIVNFYFAYTLAVILAIYGIILSIYNYKDEGYKKIIKVLLKTLLYSLIGIMISAFILLPTGISYINSVRKGGNTILVYSLSYYRSIINELLSVTGIRYWSVIGIQSLALITIPVFILKYRKKESSIFKLFLILLLPIFIAPIGSIFMGFNFPNNRWSYAISFIFALMTTSVLNDNQRLEKKDFIAISLMILFYLGANILFEIRLSYYAAIQLFMLIIWLLILYLKEPMTKYIKKINLYNVSLIFIMLLGIGTSIKYLYDINGESYVSEFVGKTELPELIASADNSIPDFLDALYYIQDRDNGFYKIVRNPYEYDNISLLEHFNSFNLFYSIIPNDFMKLDNDIANIQVDPTHYAKEYDYRTKIITLLGAKYFINYGNQNVPYGFTKANYKGDSVIYRNNYYLPFGLLYTNYISEDDYEKLTPLEKESSLLKSTVLEKSKVNKNLTNIKKNYDDTIVKVNYTLEDPNEIFINDNNLQITNTSKKSFVINIDDVLDGELYISFKNLNYKAFSKEELVNLHLTEESNLIQINQVKNNYKWYQPTTAYNLNVKTANVSKTFAIEDSYTAYYVDINDFLFNLGYYKKSPKNITITLSSLGNYSFDDIEIYSVKMDDYEQDINNLRRSNFKVTDWNNGYLNGEVNAESSGILQFQTMYNDGWKVYVDDKEVETLKSNKYFLGINIDKGKHKIHLEYHTPYVKEGIIVSLSGVVIFIGLIIFKKKYKK